MVCARCGHANDADARFCSSCGSPLVADEESTLTLSAVEAAETDDDLARYLDGLPTGVAMLVVRHGPAAGSSFRLEQPVITIGRHPSCDIFLDDITVSRRHVRIERHDGEFSIRDVGSLNGTYVNRERVEESALRHGDELQVGRYRLSFVQGHDRLLR